MSKEEKLQVLIVFLLLIIIFLIMRRPPEVTDKQTAVVTRVRRVHNLSIRTATRRNLVWVDTATGIYWLPSDSQYGKTKNGGYMREPEAVDSGYHLEGFDDGSGDENISENAPLEPVDVPVPEKNPQAAPPSDDGGE